METTTKTEQESGNITPGVCAYCDEPGVITIGSLKGRIEVTVCSSDLHLDAAIWGGDPR